MSSGEERKGSGQVAEKTSTRSRRIKRPSGGTVILLVAVLLGVTVLAPTVQQFVSQRQRIADLEAHIETVQTEVGELQAEQARWSDPAYIQAQARGRLLFVKPGETTYLVTDSAGGLPAVAPVDTSPDMHETQNDWVESLAQSFVTSGMANGPQPPTDPVAPTNLGPAPPVASTTPDPADLGPADPGPVTSNAPADPGSATPEPVEEPVGTDPVPPADIDPVPPADTPGATP